MKDLKQIHFLLMGTPELARDVFQSIHQAGYQIVGLVCQPDTLTGRDKTWTKPPTKIWAEANQIPVFQPEKIKEDHQFLNDLDVDYILTLAYGQIVHNLSLINQDLAPLTFMVVCYPNIVALPQSVMP